MPDHDTAKICLNCGNTLGKRQTLYCSRLCCNTHRCGVLAETPPNPSGLCMCGCGQKTAIAKVNCSRHGNLAGYPVKFVKNHHFRVPEYNSRIAGRVNRRKNVRVFSLDEPLKYFVIDEMTGCWNWIRTKNKEGYGRIVLNGKYLRAHRVVYEHLVGAIPAGKELDHLCRNRGCVNPAHLEPVTKSENVRREWIAKRSEQS